MTTSSPPNHTVKANPAPWDRFLFEAQSTSPAALLRIGWGPLATVWALTFVPDVDPFLTDGALRYERSLSSGSWNPLEWISWSGAPLTACILLIVAGLATTVGYRTRLSSAVAVLCMIALQRSNGAILNSGDLMLRQIGIAVALAPAGLVLSADAARQRRGGGHLSNGDPVPLRAPWALRLLQLEVALGYGLSCWAKLRGTTWHEGTALGLAMRIEDLQRFAAPEWLYDREVLINLATWGTLVFEGAFGFLVWSRRLRPWVLFTGVAFHLAIDVLFDVGFFSAAMWLSYLAFVPPHAADRAVAKITRMGPRRRGVSVDDSADGPASRVRPPPPGDRDAGGARRR